MDVHVAPDPEHQPSLPRPVSTFPDDFIKVLSSRLELFHQRSNKRRDLLPLAEGTAGLVCGYLNTDIKTTHLTHFRNVCVFTLLHYNADIKVP